MRKPITALLVASALGAAFAAGSAQPGTTSEFGWFSMVAGKCWRGEYPNGGGDTQCYEWQYGRYLRGTISITLPGKDGAPLAISGDSVFDWDAKSGRIRYSNWSTSGSLQHGEAYYEDGVLRFPDVRSRDEEPRTRSSWRRIDDGRFEVTRERREGDSWVAEFSVTYQPL
ncbi:MAG TPA: hypothetical protein VJL86_06440 [Steroidobacteraceae bacterium]|nr:hypothetical protein [Steroidobacteraceae bacterium]